ncbi:hypothetical protein MTE01_16530 [Microbacterium testaceum]|uniref:Uncharacterized protein n=1 Tax=Microbacterium testaceum TaxID=2033 RepID=A0A4Y3QMI0_MICTE|nr:hypothetical protein MTE01_16530 [Microbacterium testaceum]
MKDASRRSPSGPGAVDVAAFGTQKMAGIRWDRKAAGGFVRGGNHSSNFNEHAVRMAKSLP